MLASQCGWGNVAATAQDADPAPVLLTPGRLPFLRWLQAEEGLLTIRNVGAHNSADIIVLSAYPGGILDRGGSHDLSPDDLVTWLDPLKEGGSKTLVNIDLGYAHPYEKDYFLLDWEDGNVPDYFGEPNDAGSYPVEYWIKEDGTRPWWDLKTFLAEQVARLGFDGVYLAGVNVIAEFQDNGSNAPEGDYKSFQSEMRDFIAHLVKACRKINPDFKVILEYGLELSDSFIDKYVDGIAAQDVFSRDGEAVPTDDPGQVATLAELNRFLAVGKWAIVMDAPLVIVDDEVDYESTDVLCRELFEQTRTGIRPYIYKDINNPSQPPFSNIPPENFYWVEQLANTQ